MPDKKLRIAVLLSGSGSTLENIFNKIDEGYLNCEIDIVISSKAGAYGLERAARRSIDTAVVESRKYFTKGVPDWESMSAAINEVLFTREVGLICLCGFMCFYNVPEEFYGRVMNVHPALIPSFCGKGMYGHHVHEAVKQSGVKLSGCTVHFVNNQYDAGPIIVQRCCSVCDTDSADDIAARVMAEERKAYPEAIKLFAEDRLHIDSDIVRVDNKQV